MYYIIYRFTVIHGIKHNRLSFSNDFFPNLRGKTDKTYSPDVSQVIDEIETNFQRLPLRPMTSIPMKLLHGNNVRLN